MKETLLSCLKYLLYGAAVVLVVLLVFGFVLMMNWPWWVGICLLLILAGLCVGAVFLWKVRLRKREQHAVQEVIDQDEAQLKKLTGEEQGGLNELQASWKEAVERLKGSHLKKQGNPLYVLPWYLVMGESGSGKSSAIKGARLSSPFSELTQSDETGGTRNCDWWFFDQAILMDTTGRYTKPLDPSRDNQEWQRFLSLLVKYRKKEPIHGLIVTVAADKLMKGTPQELENDGRQLRRRIDELMRVLGMKFPVYALVTKCDLIQGMTQFCDRLPSRSLDQAMGVANEELSADAGRFLERFASILPDRLRRLRLLLLNRPDAPPAGAGLLLFPDEVQSLKPGIETFMRAAFQENRYQDTPLLRGIYFSSARQSGMPLSRILAEYGFLADKEGLPGTNRGLFLHDFFEKVLPRDRGLVAPTSRSIEWRSLTRNLGLTSWVLIGLALCGLLSYSFVKNMSTIREASAVMARTPELNGNFMTDLATMDRFRQMIVTVEQKNRDWWMPRFGLKESLKVEMALKARFCKQFQERFLASFDRNMGQGVAGLTQGTPDDVSGRYIVHLSRRINLLKARLEGAGPDQLKSKPLPSYVIEGLQQGDDRETTRKFGSMYVNYLVWRSDNADLGKEVQVLQSLLKQVYLVKGGNLAWLLDFANRQEPGAAITMQSFWGGSRTIQGEPVIQPAFTRKGKEYVTTLVNELAAAYPEAGVLDREKASFESWYRKSCFDAWQRFAVFLPKGEERLAGARDWQRAAEVMATEQGPYLGFMKRAVTELEAFGITEGVPPWLAQVYQYQLLKNAPASGAAAAAAEEGKKIAEKLGKLVGREGATLASLESQASSAKTVQEYLGALSQIAPVAKSRNMAHQMAQQVFSEDAAVSKSPLYLAADAANRLNSTLTQGRPDDTFARLISSPITFYGTYVRMETACSLQKQWEDKVLKEVQGASDPQTLQYILGKEGPVWKFVSASADPFIGWTPGRGYYSKTALGGSVPFEPGFYSFLTKGAKAKIALAAAPVKQNYTVSLKGLPTDANADARTKPQSTRLELQCAAGPQTIENMNYPVSKTFSWTPECGEVVFHIEVGDNVLVKRYQGLPDFLHDFPGGRHTFYPQDFPREKQALERMGIRFIRANYQIFGGQEIASAGAAGKGLPGQVPARITQCWD